MTIYHYTESGLQNVYIEGLEPMVDDDGDITVQIPMINDLHRAIALGIVSHEKGMSSQELRFLRSEMGMTQAELAQLVHRDKQSVGRWERGDCPMEGSVEAIIRAVAIERLGLAGAPTIERLARMSIQTAEIQPININHVAGQYELAAA